MTPDREVLLRQGWSARRAWLFIRDWWSELPSAWDIARMRDCDRQGGHVWARPAVDDFFGLGITCKRCKVFQSLHKTDGTSVTNCTHYVVNPDA